MDKYSTVHYCRDNRFFRHPTNCQHDLHLERAQSVVVYRLGNLDSDRYISAFQQQCSLPGRWACVSNAADLYAKQDDYTHSGCNLLWFADDAIFRSDCNANTAMGVELHISTARNDLFCRRHRIVYDNNARCNGQRKLQRLGEFGGRHKYAIPTPNALLVLPKRMV